MPEGGAQLPTKPTCRLGTVEISTRHLGSTFPTLEGPGAVSTRLPPGVEVPGQPMSRNPIGSETLHRPLDALRLGARQLALQISIPSISSAWQLRPGADEGEYERARCKPSFTTYGHFPLLWSKPEPIASRHFLPPAFQPLKYTS